MKKNIQNKDCTCGILRGIESGHYEDCPNYKLNPKEKAYMLAINKALKRQHFIDCNCRKCVSYRGFVY